MSDPRAPGEEAGGRSRFGRGSPGSLLPVLGLLGGTVAVGAGIFLAHPSFIGWHPSLSLGVIVTMVGPLGVTFPCWAARHPARRAAAASASG